MSVRARLSTVGGPFPRSTNALDRVAARLRRPLDRAVFARAGRLADLRKLSAEVAPAPPSGRRVLILSLRAWPNHTAYEGVIAHALRMRGAEVALVTCGGGMPVCEMGWGRHVYPRPCDRCAWHTDRYAEATGIRTYRLRDGFGWGARPPDAPADPPAAPVDVRWAARISVPWFLKSTDVEGAPDGAAARRDYEVAAAGVAEAASEILDDFKPDAVLMVNGTFAAERAFRALADERGIRTPSYEIGHRANTLFMSQGAPACDLDAGPVWETVKDVALTPEQDEALERLLVQREHGEGAHERYFETTERDTAALRTALGLTDRARVAALFTNMTWDSAAVDHDIGFESLNHWVAEAAAAVRERDDTRLVVRVHPAEATWGTNEDLRQAIESRIGSLPGNVRIVRADEPLDSYALARMSDLVLTYTTTVGLEAAARGSRVAVAGATHYRDRGFTIDLDGPDALRRVLHERPGRPSADEVERARRYAYTFFFRTLIPFPAMDVRSGRVARVPGVAQLAPGADPYLDMICDRIVDGGEFAVPEELLRPSPT